MTHSFEYQIIRLTPGTQLFGWIYNAPPLKGQETVQREGCARTKTDMGVFVFYGCCKSFVNEHACDVFFRTFNM